MNTKTPTSKYVCLDSDSYIGGLTTGKVYDGYIWNIMIYVVDDNDYLNAYASNRFKLLTEVREDKLNSLFKTHHTE